MSFSHLTPLSGLQLQRFTFSSSHRGGITFEEKALNCQRGGGITAIIYDNEASGTGRGFVLSSPTEVRIPVVGTSYWVGNAIVRSYLGQTGRLELQMYASFDGTSTVRNV